MNKDKIQVGDLVTLVDRCWGLSEEPVSLGLVCEPSSRFSGYWEVYLFRIARLYLYNENSLRLLRTQEEQNE